ncbi:MAG: preprotein translocase subunit YajC [Verrucomicrobiaceae bacterium]|jgi:preprotein translocase subunit YajC|nr:preprotein translocase subunit YajC [Verrucomicrobiaceae bacterium]
MTTIASLADIATSITLAQAAGPGAAPGGLLGNPLVFMVLMIVMMYFLLIRPQRKRQQEHESLIKSLSVGDHVVMSGGEHGIVTSLHEKTLKVKIADNVKVEYERSSVGTVIKKSDIKDVTPESAA